MFVLAIGIIVILCGVAARRRVAYRQRREATDERLNDIVRLLAHLAARSEEDQSRRPALVADAIARLKLRQPAVPFADTWCVVALAWTREN